MKRRDAIKTAIGSLLGFLAAPFVAKAAPVEMRRLTDPRGLDFSKHRPELDTWASGTYEDGEIYGIRYWLENGKDVTAKYDAKVKAMKAAKP
jgi:hypothetical protein